KLEEILRFDLGHNGATLLLPIRAEAETLATKSSFDHLGTSGDWQTRKIFFVVKTKVADKKLSLRLLTVNAQSIKAIDSILLTGDLSQDRRKIHQVADMIHKELFNREGVASTRFLYTMKVQNGAKQWLSDVWEADYDGGNARQITHGKGYCVTPTYFPAAPGF